MTELTTGLDLVKLQLHVAAGGRLEGEPPPVSGYAIEARLNAEDPQRSFAPAPGTITTLSLPVGPGVRVDTGVAEGDVIPPEYDSMIAKVIASGRDRDEAIARLHRALSQMTVVVSGGTTNKSFLLDLLDRPEVRAGDIDTAWLDRLTATGDHVPTRHADIALVAAVLDAGALLEAAERASFLEWARRGRPHADVEIGREIELRHGGLEYRARLRATGVARAEVELDGVVAAVDVERLGRRRHRLTFGAPDAPVRAMVVSSVQGSEHLVEVDGVAHRFSRDDAGIVRAPAAALVVAVDVEPGDVVDAGARLGVVEAMKMEIAIPAPVGGRVRDVFVTRNVQVDAGAPLFRLEPARDDVGADGDGRGRDRITLDALRGGTVDPAATLEAFVLGFDVPADVASAATDELCRAGGWRGADLLRVLDMFAELVSISPERRDVDDEARASRELFNTYLRSLDVEGEGLPEWFGDRLRRVVSHYGVADLDPGPALESALLRAFVAQQRRESQLPIDDDHPRPVVGDRRRGGPRRPRDARPGHRRHPPALPGDRQHGPGRAPPALRSPAHRSGPCRGVDGDAVDGRGGGGTRPQQPHRVRLRSTSSSPGRCRWSRSWPPRTCLPARPTLAPCSRC